MKIFSCQVGLSCTDFFEMFHGDNATYSYSKFFANKQAKNI